MTEEERCDDFSCMISMKSCLKHDEFTKSSDKQEILYALQFCKAHKIYTLKDITYHIEKITRKRCITVKNSEVITYPDQFSYSCSNWLYDDDFNISVILMK